MNKHIIEQLGATVNECFRMLRRLAKHTWSSSSDDMKVDFMRTLDCCGFDDDTQNLGVHTKSGHPPCVKSVSTEVLIFLETCHFCVISAEVNNVFNHDFKFVKMNACLDAAIHILEAYLLI